MPIRTPKRPFFLALALFGILASVPASAIFLQAPDVPAERLIKNLNAYLKDKPKDAQAHFLLGRVHYIAFVNRTDSIQASNEGSEKKLPNITDPRRQYKKNDAKGINQKQAIEHAKSAIVAFDKAIELNNKNALYPLGLAGIYEQSMALAKDIDPNPQPKDGEGKDQPSESQRFAAEAVKAYLVAWELDREAALKKNSVFLPFYPAAYEAGKAVLRLVNAYKIKVDDKTLEQIKKDLAEIDKKPKAITPVIMRITGTAPTSLDDLLADGKTVLFDLDADGTAEERPWVKPDTAILVWDPEEKGMITSGKQMFGNMTFMMLFSDGYRALDSLDNDRDGKLQGKEMKGLALWYDTNSNGVSDEGEVTPIRKTAIRSLATQPTGTHGIHPMCAEGVTLINGNTRPTWDWIITTVTRNMQAGE